MFTKNVKGVIIPRHDTAENWAKAVHFTPSRGEFIIYDADEPGVNYNTSVVIDETTCEVTSSQVVRFKIGNGKDNVNALKFVTGIDKDWVKEYIESRTDVSTLVYLNTKEEIGQNLELQDVFPVQSDEIKLKVVSKNILNYLFSNKTLDEGVNISINNSCVKLTGKATSAIKQDIHLVNLKFDVPGKYVLSSSTWGLGVEDGSTATKKCYLTYSLSDDEGSAFCLRRKALSSDNQIILDTQESNCHQISLFLHIDVPTGATFEDSNSLEFNLQLEYGDTATTFTPQIDITDLEGIKVNVYGRNLFKDEWVYDESLQNSVGFPSPKAIGDSVFLNGESVGTIDGYDVNYFNGIMTEDTYITYWTSGDTTPVKIKTPLKKGDKFTLSYVVTNIPETSVLLVCQRQLLYGHTDYEKYQKFESSVITSSYGGVCDITALNYPYSFINIDESEPNRDKLSLYIKYDPALSRNWTEKELDRLKSLIGTSGGSTPGATTPVKGVDYWTAEDKQEIVDSVLSSLELSATGIKLNDAVTDDAYTLYVADGKLTLRKESDQ